MKKIYEKPVVLDTLEVEVESPILSGSSEVETVEKDLNIVTDDYETNDSWIGNNPRNPFNY